jgi:hypothetical protein
MNTTLPADYQTVRAYAAQPWDSAFQPGMSLRDWFAGQALATIPDGTPAEMAAAACYRYADALLTHRQLPTEN